MITVIIIANLIVGTLVGISGIAGFLLPITLHGFLGLPMTDALALSFLSFLTSGILGSWSYHKKGDMDWEIGIPLCIGSLAGALLGVKLNLIIPVALAKVLLYTVVLLSGISVLLKKEPEKQKEPHSKQVRGNFMLVSMGVMIAAICSLTGAGGPVLAVPLLALLGVNLRTAVAVSLLDSVAIALPAAIGYMSRASVDHLALLSVCSVASHSIGVLTGAKISGKVNLRALRLLVGILSISAACYMLVKTLFFY